MSRAEILAVHAARESNMIFHVGCTIVCQGKVVATGYNHFAQPFENEHRMPWKIPKDKRCSYHAEMHAIEQLLRARGLWKRAQQLLKYLHACDITIYDPRAIDLNTQATGLNAKRPSPFAIGRHIRRTAHVQPSVGHRTRIFAHCNKRALSCARANTIDIYVARVRVHENLYGCAKPCAECIRWIYVASRLGIHVRNIFHTIDSANMEFVSYDGIPHMYYAELYCV